VYASCSGAASVCIWAVVAQGVYTFKKNGFLEEFSSDGLAKIASKMA
jgi:hypothetical protein